MTRYQIKVRRFTEAGETLPAGTNLSQALKTYHAMIRLLGKNESVQDVSLYDNHRGVVFGRYTFSLELYEGN